MAEELAPGPVVILDRPQMGENIGAAARAMWNFGLRRMRLIAPRDGWPNPKAVAMASGAGRLLEDAALFETAEAALGDLSTIYATTARPRGLTKRVLAPEAAMREARARMAEGERVGLLFGPERAGLETAEIVRASAIVTVPVNPDFPSLNLAQCVLLLAYEWRRQGEAVEPALAIPRGGRPAEHLEVARLLDHLVEKLDEARFFYPEAKRESMEVHLRNLFHRLELTEADIRTLHGVVRALGRGAG
ncbi:MAG: RNA methyltransferase [Pseudomonadota bacterium]